MIDDDFIRRVEGLSSFATNSHRIANATGCSDQDARHYLLTQVCYGRHVEGVDDEKLGWLITYAKRDFLRKWFKTKRRQEATIEYLKQTHVVALSYTLDKTQLDNIRQILPQVFNRKRTIEFVYSVLAHGQQETQAKFNLSAQQFKQKIRNIERYCDSNRQRFINVVISHEQARLINEHDKLKQFTDMIEQHYTDDAMQALIDNNLKLIDNLVGGCPMCRPVDLLYKYKYSRLSDRYKLVNAIYARLTYIERRLSYESTSM